MQLYKTACLSNITIKCSVTSQDIYDTFKRNGDKNEICKCCGSSTVNQIVIFAVSMSKFSGGRIIGARKHYSFSAMVNFTLQYIQGRYYYLSTFFSDIQDLLKDSLWITSAVLNEYLVLNVNYFSSVCLYNKLWNAISFTISFNCLVQMNSYTVKKNTSKIHPKLIHPSQSNGFWKQK